jgi:hypothetical protein
MAVVKEGWTFPGRGRSNVCCEMLHSWVVYMLQRPMMILALFPHGTECWAHGVAQVGHPSLLIFKDQQHGRKRFPGSQACWQPIAGLTSSHTPRKRELAVKDSTSDGARSFLGLEDQPTSSTAGTALAYWALMMPCTWAERLCHDVPSLHITKLDITAAQLVVICRYLRDTSLIRVVSRIRRQATQMISRVAGR